LAAFEDWFFFGSKMAILWSRDPTSEARYPDMVSRAQKWLMGSKMPWPRVETFGKFSKKPLIFGSGGTVSSWAGDVVIKRRQINHGSRGRDDEVHTLPVLSPSTTTTSSSSSSCGLKGLSGLIDKIHRNVTW
jgi:hypothetical protein